jgi:hypothetical protein
VVVLAHTDPMLPSGTIAGCTAEQVRLDQIRAGESMRDRVLDEDHLQNLMVLDGNWGSILVWRKDNVVLDGLHRVEAARNLGYNTISCTWFEGTYDEAFVEAVSRNVRHGLPLSIGERSRAAARILELHPEWSDRRLAKICAVSPKMVSRVRRERAGRSRQPASAGDTRVGLDGRRRPVRPELMRLRIEQELRKNPEASLRTIAGAIGVSPETVRGVRTRLRSGTKEEARSLVTEPVLGLGSEGGTLSIALSTEGDPAFASSSSAQAFVNWFDARGMTEDWHNHVHAIPVSRIYEIADEARRRADCWLEFARCLESRAARRDAIRA